jgi:HlyD family secretion protein
MGIDANNPPMSLTIPKLPRAEEGLTLRGHPMKAFFSFLFSVKTIILFLLVVGLAGGAFYIYRVETANAAGPGFRTDIVVRKNLSATINATGTIEPEKVVDVGAQVNGLILKFGADPTDPTGERVVDYCTPVEQGTILAQIDPTIYQARLDQATNALLAAKKGLASSEFNIAKASANRDALKDAYLRDERSTTGVAQAQVVIDKGAYDAAIADVNAQEATKEQAAFTVKQAEANLKEAQTNLDYCTIKASVKGVIVDRRVNVGQTVVSAQSAPSLFLLAKDLMRLQVWASVNEADIGHIHKGQDVTFTVDARPGQVFQGTVQEIRYNATMTQNVVTYTVVVATQNQVMETPVATKVRTPGGRTVITPSSGSTELVLLPYLTANVTFHVADRAEALLVPNSALRWRPQLPQVAPEFRDEYEQSLRKKAAKDEAGGEVPAAAPDKKPIKKPEGGGVANRGMVWVQDGTFVRPIRLQTGLTDGVMTEVVRVHQDDNLHRDDALDVGTVLVSGENTGQAASATNNPFQMKLFAPKKKPDQQ